MVDEHSHPTGFTFRGVGGAIEIQIEPSACHPKATKTNDDAGLLREIVGQVDRGSKWAYAQTDAVFGEFTPAILCERRGDGQHACGDQDEELFHCVLV